MDRVTREVDEMATKTEGTARLVRAQVSNVLGIKLAEVKFGADGGMVVIGGENGAGKSSLLDALRWALDGVKPKGKELLHHGADKGVVTLDLAGEVVEVRRAVTEKGTTLKVTGPDGGDLKKPQGVLDALCGRFGIDPTEFLTLNEEQQAKRVQEVMGVDFTDLDADYKRLYEERTNANRRVRDAEGELRNLPKPETGDTTEEVVLSELVNHIAEVETLERSFEADGRRIETLRCESAEHKAEIETLDQRIAMLREKRAKVIEEGKQLATKVADNNDAMDRNRAAGTDAAGLRAKLANAETINARVAVSKRRSDAEGKVRVLGIDAERVDKALAAVQVERSKRIEAAPLCIAGVDIQNGVVCYNNAPLSEASDGQRLKVAFEIAAAGNPDLRVLFLRHGALLDSKNRQTVADLARERGYTVVMEVVGTSGIDVLIEEGVAK